MSPLIHTIFIYFLCQNADLSSATECLFLNCEDCEDCQATYCEDRATLKKEEFFFSCLCTSTSDTDPGTEK